MKNMEICIEATLANKDKVFPETEEQMSLRYNLTKGHLTRSQNKTKPTGSNRHSGFLENSVYFEEAQSSISDILLFLEFKCIKREPTYIECCKSILLEGQANAVVSSVPFKTFTFSLTMC